jgi:hypothetical protein
MEELQSTEVLDREILEDARKKAFRALKSADDAIRDVALAWERKTKSALSELGRKYAEKTEKDGKDIMARLIQDKRRARSVKIESLLKGAAREYLANLDRKKLLALLETELARRFAELSDQGEPITEGDAPVIMARALTAKEAEKIVNAAFLGGKSKSNSAKKTFWTYAEPDIFFLSKGEFPAIVVNTPKVKITASVEDSVAVLLEDKRFELTEALLGKDALGGGA